MKINQRPSPNFTRGRQGLTPDMIVYHITDGSFPGSINWVTNPVSQVSYHFMISSTGGITQCVDIANTAWANGTTNGNDIRGNQTSLNEIVRSRNVNANNYTISIGHEGRHNETKGALTNAQLSATVWLTNKLREDVQRDFNFDIPLNRLHLVGHNEITPRHRPNCPGYSFPWDKLIKKLQTSEEVQEVRFNTVAEMPEWARADMQELIDTGHLRGTSVTPNGNPTGFDLSLDMIRTIILNKRQIDALKGTVSSLGIKM